jgi:pyruvate dehydrogenase E2 component (dihydrolipoamide acetyltransferase)
MSAAISAVTMPKWGLTMTEGKVVGWLKEQGESFAQGEEILEIETTKITNVVEASEAGTLRRILAPAGTTLPVGALLAVVAGEEAPEAEIDAFIADFGVVEPSVIEQADGEGGGPREIEVAGLRLRCLELGEGDRVPVLLLHGFGADLNTWMFIQPELAAGRRTVALDLPGHGGSAKEVGAGDPDSLTDFAEGALDALSIERVHLVGHSMGGGISLLSALRRPERVASLTLIASAGLGAEINTAFIGGFVRATRRREMADVLNLLVRDPALVSRTMVEDVLRYKRLDGVSAALARIAEAWFAGGRQSLDLAQRIATLVMPVQVIWGREDRIIPVAHAEVLASRLPVHILDEAGHLPHMEKASEVTRLVSRFIQQPPP